MNILGFHPGSIRATLANFWRISMINFSRSILVLAAIVLVPRQAVAELFRFECAAGNTQVAHIVEIDSQTQQAKMWAQFSPTLTNGPFSPFTVTVTSQKITWTDKKISGRAASTTTYILDRANRSLSIHIDYNAFMD